MNEAQMDALLVKDIIHTLPRRFKANEAEYEEGIFHFDIEGEDGGAYTVQVQNGECTVVEGFEGTPNCVIRAKDKHYKKVETGQMNAQMAVMMGKLKISDLGEMIKFISYFKKLEELEFNTIVQIL